MCMQCTLHATIFTTQTIMIFFFALQGDPGMSNRHFYIENSLNVIAVNNLVERLIVWDYSF